MDVVERKSAPPTRQLRRQTLDKRPVNAQNNIVASLQACERKRDSVRGSGLRYVLDNLNAQCHLLSPAKLVEVLRVISDNQLFDRRSIYSLSSVIARNLLYFTPCQHRVILESLAKCMVFTVQHVSSAAIDEHNEALFHLKSILNHRETIQHEEPQAYGGNTANAPEAGDTSVVAIPTTEQNDEESISMAEINLMHLEILSSISRKCIKTISGGSHSNLVDNLLLLGSALDNLIMLSCSTNVPYRSLMASSMSLVEGITEACLDNSTCTTPKLKDDLLVKLSNTVENSLFIALVEQLPLIRHKFPVSLYDKSDYRSLSSALRLAQLHNMAQLRSAYVKGDTTVMYMIIEELIDACSNSQNQQLGLMSLHLQGFIRDLKRIHDRLAQINIALSPNIKNSNEDYIILKCKMLNMEKLLCLFDNGQIVKNWEEPIRTTKHKNSLAIRTLLEDIKDSMELLSPRSVCHLIGMIAGEISIEEKTDRSAIHGLLSHFFGRIYKHSSELHVSEILYTIEKCYHRLGFIHHYATRIMIKRSLSGHINTGLDALLMANIHALCFTIPYNIVTPVEYKNLYRMLCYLSKDKAAYQAFLDIISTATIGERHECPPAIRDTGNHQEGSGFRNKRYTSGNKPRRDQCIASSYRIRSGLINSVQSRKPTIAYIHQKNGGSYLFRLWKFIGTRLVK